MRKNGFIHVTSNVIIVAVLALLVVICFDTQSQYVFGNTSSEAIYHGNKNSNKVSLMINVYWGTEYLDSMLATLQSYDVKCTFFVGGQWVEKEPEYLQKIHADGHEIANHGYFHRDHKKLSYDQNYEEIYNTHQIVKANINIDMKLFAPPSGEYNKTTLQVAQTLGYTTIMWSKDTIDWRDKDASVVLSRATKNVGGGDLILMHPTVHTAEALPQILQYYKTNNLQACTVSENVK